MGRNWHNTHHHPCYIRSNPHKANVDIVDRLGLICSIKCIRTNNVNALLSALRPGGEVTL